IPKLLLWAKPGMILNEKSVRAMEKEIKNLETAFLGKGKHYIQEDHPAKIGNAISGWLKKIR
ncbi:MAG: haloalkane dehalogenase, partial [Spirochaetia bacterium]|nr:haloalkane dehalogenase [Spirochaetia bacterium]